MRRLTLTGWIVVLGVILGSAWSIWFLVDWFARVVARRMGYE